MSAGATRRTTSSGPIACGHCAFGGHRQCRADWCACALSGHTPDDALAAAMARTVRPDLGPFLSRDVARSAAIWRNTFPGPSS